MIESQVPRLVMSDDALESEPETVDARSDCELTVASGSAASMSVCTAAICVGGLGLHVDGRDHVADAGEVLRDIERDVDVRRRVGVAGRRGDDADDLHVGAADVDRVADGELARSWRRSASSTATSVPASSAVERAARR